VVVAAAVLLLFLLQPKKEMAVEVAAVPVGIQVLQAGLVLQVAIEPAAAAAALEVMVLLLVTAAVALYYCVSPIAILLLFLVAFPVLFIIQKVVITFI
jgi:hypothetical protein